MRTLLVLSMCLYPLLGASQPAHISGRIHGFSDGYVVLLGYNGVEEFPVDSAIVRSPADTFIIQISLPYIGLYKLLVERGKNRSPDKYIDLILQAGTSVYLETQYPYITDSLNIVKGDEQKYFTRFTQQYNRIQYKLYLTEDLLARYPPDDPFYKDLVTNKTRLNAEKNTLYKRFTDSAFPVANRYIQMLRQWDLRGNAFEGPFYQGIDISDTLWIRNTLLHQKIGQYYNFLMSKSRGSDFFSMNKTFIDDVLNPLKSNALLYKNIFIYLVNSYKTMQYTDALEYLKSKYITDNLCTEADQNPDIDYIIQSIHAFKAGDLLPSAVFQKPDGRDFRFPAELASGRAGLLILWSSRCGHCRESKPYWTELFQKYGDKGLQITALHLESESHQWLADIQSLPSEWTHLHDPLGWSGYAHALKLFGTPAYILYDRSFRLILKSYDLTEVRERLHLIL